ncbi:MAG: hypothetical protein PHH70_05160 [Candidatus Gracilibacteria bacterium]|nr:hypothetical protein [Candidatus Gracilibacteria bacterium]
MKKSIVYFGLVGLCLMSGINVTFASGGGGSVSEDTSAETSASPTTTTVTEKIPGMDCQPVGSDTSVTKRKYKCTIQPGFGSVMDILKGLIKYATFLTALIGTLMLVYSGIEYSMAGASGDDVKHSKSRIMKVLAGLVLLFLIGFVLNSVAPWIYK